MKALTAKILNVPLIAFAVNQWQLLTVFIVTNWLCKTETHFVALGEWRISEQLGGFWAPRTPLEWAGPLLWLLPLGIGTYLMTMLMIHLHFRMTINSDINSGKFIEYWNAAPGELKLKLIFAAIIGITLALAILYAGLARA